VFDWTRGWRRNLGRRGDFLGDMGAVVVYFWEASVGVGADCGARRLAQGGGLAG
jgi:hypothetical protein